jgi:hypothetical protein
VKQKKTWEEDFIGFLEDSLTETKKIKRDYLDLLVLAEAKNATRAVSGIKETLNVLDIAIKFFETELKKKLVKKT